jgi:hypothetical protein
MSRLMCGVIAAVIGIVAGIAAAGLETRFYGSYRPRTLWTVFFAAGGAVFWFADFLGILSAPYTPPPIDLRGTQDGVEGPAKDVK